MVEATFDLPPGFDEMSIDDQISYVQALRDRIVSSGQDKPVPEEHVQVVRERLASYQRDPEAARPWNDVRARIEQELDRGD